MKAKELIAYLESVAPLQLQESYDNSGLLVGDASAELNGILVTLDITEEVIDEAIKKKCNMVLAHHPIIFGGLKKITGKNYVERAVIKAIKNDVLLYAAHTNLDNIFDGVNRRMAETLGLSGLKILSEKRSLLKRLITFSPAEHAENVRKAMFSAGAGQIGNYDECSFSMEGTGTFRAGEGADPFIGEIGKRAEEKEHRIETIFPAYLQEQVVRALLEAHPYEEVAYDIIALENSFQKAGAGMVGTLETPMKTEKFLDLVKARMKAGMIRHTLRTKETISKVAVCGGSGSFLLKEAISAGADAFVTADFKYHQFFDAEGRIMIVDIGHFESEQFTVDLLAELVQKKFPTFAVRLSETRTNPIYYL